MYNRIDIGLPYNSGRYSGGAMHGKARSKFAPSDRADGRIRVQHFSFDKVWAMLHLSGRPGPESPLWSEAVQDDFISPLAKDARRGNRQDGAIPTSDATGERLNRPGNSELFVRFRNGL